MLLFVGAVWGVLAPILRPSTRAFAATDEPDDPDDDLSPRAVALRALKEIEFDRATGKLSDGDYESLKAQYTAAALTALRGEAAAPIPNLQSPTPSLQSPIPALSIAVACPVHGPRPEAGAIFCSTCGRRLGDASEFCGRCGRPLEDGSRFCGRCGSRVAA